MKKKIGYIALLAIALESMCRAEIWGALGR